MAQITATRAETVVALNKKAFGAKDLYSDPKEVLRLFGKRGDCLLSGNAGYLLYWDAGDYLMIERIGVLKDQQRKGIAKALLRQLVKLAKKIKKPIRTYVRFDNLPSYLLHMKMGFYPTHVAWNTYVWIEKR
jgi:GNAT superfamily N-acetyltransferase